MKTEKIAYRILDKNRKLFDLLAYEGNIPMPELDLQAIHEVVVKESPIRIPVSKGKMLDAIISKAFESVFGQQIYKSDREKAACIMQEITRLHPFSDGNKRTALLAACVYLEMKNQYNGIPKDAFELINRIASNPDKDHVEEIANWF